MIIQNRKGNWKMSNKNQNIIERKALQKKLNQEVEVVGRVESISHKRELGYGYNIRLPKILFVPIIIDGKKYDHMWIKTKKINCPFGTIYQFVATVKPYKKFNGHISFSLTNLRDIRQVESLQLIH